MVDWIAGHWIEIAGALLSILYLVLSIRQNILLWPVGLLSALFYVVVFFQSKFYADMALNVYYFGISIYGWVSWSGMDTSKKNDLKVEKAGKKRILVLFSIILVLFLLAGFFLDRYTDSPVPFWDALTTSGSIVATWMLARKIIEHWIIWIFVDLISMGLYIEKELYPTAVLFAIYTGMAVVGLIQWRRSIKNHII